MVWTATPSNCAKDLVYQFSLRPRGDAFRVARDFSPHNTFAWSPMQEGSYDIRVIAKDGYQGTDTVSAVVADAVDSRVTGSHAVVTAMPNPLVALYSAPPCSDGTIAVEFRPAGHHPQWRSTNVLPCEPGQSRNFLVAGMLPDTTYQMRHVVTRHHHSRHSSPLAFTTGAIPPAVVFPSFTVAQPPGPGSDLDRDMLFHQFGRAAQNAPNPFVTDLQGHVMWYYDVSQSGLILSNAGQGHSLVPDGTVLVIATDGDAPLPNSRNVLREIDLAGNPLRETNVAAVNAQLTALGHDIIYSFSHDVQRLPNGQTAVIGITERTVNINGTPTDYVGMMIVVLNADLQVTWAWDAFDHLDVNRGPVLGEVVQPGSPEPSAAVPRLPAVDWLHINAVSWSPADGNLVLSIRHQDWVTKIDYRSGEGDGHVVWRLGQDGDFTADSTDPSPWFSHQHNAHYVDDSTLIVFDNGNTRRESDPNAHSRGQVWTLDERTMTATLVFNADLGNYSVRVGSAQALPNGNYVFTSGAQGEPPDLFGQSIEVRPDGTKAYVLQVDTVLYRSFRVRTLYEGISDVPQFAGGGSGATTRHRTGPRPSPAAADFNGDAFPDLAVANNGSDDVSILLNAADGAAFFYVSAPESIPAGQPFDLAVFALSGTGLLAHGYRGTGTFGSTDAVATLPEPYRFQPTDGGIAVFPGGVTLRTPGLQALYAFDLETGTVFGFAFVDVLAPARGGAPVPGPVLDLFLAEVLAGGPKPAR